MAASSQAGMLIDDFTTTQSLTVTGTGVLASNFIATGGSSIGGTRGLVGINDVNPFGLSTFVIVTSGVAAISSGPRVDPRVEFAYGFNVGGTAVDMNADLTAGGNDRIRVWFDSNDLDLTLRVFVRSTTGTGGAFSTAFSQTVLGARPTTPFVEDVLFSSILVSPTAMGDVDQIIFQFDTGPAGDVSLSRMQAVPEPASMAALAIGAAALLRRRRRA